MADDRELLSVSAALDGEEQRPEHLSSEAVAFRDAAFALRRRARLRPAPNPPDVTGAVMAALHDEGTRGRASTRRWPSARVAAAVFAGAALVGSVLAGTPGRGDSAYAQLAQRVVGGQGAVVDYDATIIVTERGWHREVPVRTYEGSFSYEVPETLRLQLDDTTAYPDERWVPNDVLVVSEPGDSWSVGRLGCPPEHRPNCLGQPSVGQRSLGLSPFTEAHLLELVVPVSAFVPAGGDEPDVATHANGIEVVTTVSRVARLIDAFVSVGDWRSFAPNDRVAMILEPATFTLRRLRVEAASGSERELWGARTAQQDRAGVELLDIEIVPDDELSPAVPEPPPTDRDGGARGFIDGPAPAHTPSAGWLPDALSPYRTGLENDDGGVSGVRSYTQGRAWIRIRSRVGWDRERLFGEVGPLVAVLDTGPAGVVYTDADTHRVALHGDGVDVEIAGSLPLDDLVRVAASLGVTGMPVPSTWLQASVVDTPPDGALLPPSPSALRIDDGVVTIAVAGAGETGYRLVEYPGSRLTPPGDPDARAVNVRGAVGRWSPRRSTLEWVEGGWVMALGSDGLDLDQLLRVASSLR